MYYRMLSSAILKVWISTTGYQSYRKPHAWKISDVMHVIRIPTFLVSVIRDRFRFHTVANFISGANLIKRYSRYITLQHLYVSRRISLAFHALLAKYVCRPMYVINERKTHSLLILIERNVLGFQVDLQNGYLYVHGLTQASKFTKWTAEECLKVLLKTSIASNVFL